MAEQLKIWLNLISNRSGWVFVVIEDVNLSACSLGCNDVVTLWHIAGLVDLARMINLSLNGNTLVFRLRTGVSRRLHDLIP